MASFTDDQIDILLIEYRKILSIFISNDIPIIRNQTNFKGVMVIETDEEEAMYNIMRVIYGNEKMIEDHQRLIDDKKRKIEENEQRMNDIQRDIARIESYSDKLNELLLT